MIEAHTRSDIDHPPAAERDELTSVVRILFAEFGGLAKGQRAFPQDGQDSQDHPVGSYARGDWVADPAGGNYSDYELRVVVNKDGLADVVE